METTMMGLGVRVAGLVGDEGMEKNGNYYNGSRV